MALQTTTLNAESHLLLDHPLLRLPHEVHRKTFKTSQKHIERENTNLTTTLAVLIASIQGDVEDIVPMDDASITDSTIAIVDPAINSAECSEPPAVVALDSMITRMQGLKRKLEALHNEEQAVMLQSNKRIAHLQDLYTIPSLIDETYDRWSRVRLDRLLADELLRNGFGESARMLAREKGIEDLVDVDVFVQCAKIEASLRRGSTTECLAWCVENKNTLRKHKSTLEFQLRLQQYIELVRTGSLREAIAYSRKHLAPHHEAHLPDIQPAAALLVYPPHIHQNPYKELYAPQQWHKLADSFVNTHHALFSLPPTPLLRIALKAGLSCLKTPACHSTTTSSTGNTASSTTSLCPICSTELNGLARVVPYAHHVRSSVEPDPVVLPNGRIYGRERLIEASMKGGVSTGKVRDPTTGEEFHENEVRKVYIS